MRRLWVLAAAGPPVRAAASHPVITRIRAHSPGFTAFELPAFGTGGGPDGTGVLGRSAGMETPCAAKGRTAAATGCGNRQRSGRPPRRGCAERPAQWRIRPGPGAPDQGPARQPLSGKGAADGRGSDRPPGPQERRAPRCADRGAESAKAGRRPRLHRRPPAVRPPDGAGWRVLRRRGLRGVSDSAPDLPDRPHRAAGRDPRRGPGPYRAPPLLRRHTARAGLPHPAAGRAGATGCDARTSVPMKPTGSWNASDSRRRSCNGRGAIHPNRRRYPNRPGICW